jgi:four helix bundle protein
MNSLELQAFVCSAGVGQFGGECPAISVFVLVTESSLRRETYEVNTIIVRLALANRSGRSRKASTTLKITVAPAIPIASGQSGRRGEDRERLKDLRATRKSSTAEEYGVAGLISTLCRSPKCHPGPQAAALTTQLRRSYSSIAANLAEGCVRNGDAELGRFCSIAMGSASELECDLLLARDLTLLKGMDYAELARQATEVKRMLTGLIQKLTADR